MRVYRVKTSPDQLRDAHSAAWQNITGETVGMIPSLVELTGVVSPYLVRQKGHGVTREAAVKMVHDGQTMSLRMEWVNPEPRDEITDLDQFVDAAAVMFSTDRLASAISMGAVGSPINIWLWRADEAEPLDVVAEGYGSSQRRSGASSFLTCAWQFADKHRSLVIQRPLACDVPGSVTFVPGAEARIAFAIWSGENNERSGQKSVSGEFVSLAIDD